MNRKNEHAKKHVLSVRVNETEWKLLQKALRKNAIDVSTVLKQGLRDFLETAS